MSHTTFRKPHTMLLLLLLALLAGNVHGWATLKKILMARLLSGPRVIAVPFPVPTGHHHPPPRPPPHHHHHHPHPLPPPPPPPPLLPVAVPIHHYHYPPTNVWETPIRKSPDITEITDLSHLHALFDAPVEQPAKLTHEHAHVDVVDYSAAAEALSSVSSGKSKASSTQSLPTYSERVAMKRPSYNPYRSDTYYAAETPNKYYTSSASSPYASKSYSTSDYDGYASKSLTKPTRQPYGPRYLDAADYPAYMAALRQYMKEKHITSPESTWNQQPTSYQTGTSRWPSYESSIGKVADYSSSQYKNYDWSSYPTHSYAKEEDKSASKQYSSPDPFDWAQYVASAYKDAGGKTSSQSSAADRYDTVSQSADAYKDSSGTTTESSTGSAKYYLEMKQGSHSTSASVTSTTSKTPTELEAPNLPSGATPSSEGANSTKKD